MTKNKLFIFFQGTIIILFLVLPLATIAISEGDDLIKVEAYETLNYNLVRVAKTIEVEGKINGDLIAIGGDVIINGPVSGDIIAVANNIKINSEIGGNVRVVAIYAEINGKVAKNANVLAGNFVLNSQAEISGDLTWWGESIKLLGSVGRDLYGGGKNISLENYIGGNVNLKVDQEGNFSLKEAGIIGGNLSYQAARKAFIPKGAKIQGETNYKAIVESKVNRYIEAAYWFKKIVSFLSLLLLGMIIVSIWPKWLEKVDESLSVKPGKTLAWGALYFLIIPFVIIALFISVIGIPSALMILVCYLIFIYLSKIFIAFWLGKKLMPGLKSSIWSLILGLIIVLLMTSLPQVGPLINLLIVFVGLGAAGQVFRESFKK